MILLAEYSVAQERFEHAGGYEYELRISQMLYGLGFRATNGISPSTSSAAGRRRVRCWRACCWNGPTC